MTTGGDIALARPEGVNRPELLPKEFTPVIDVAGFLSPAQVGSWLSVERIICIWTADVEFDGSMVWVLLLLILPVSHLHEVRGLIRLLIVDDSRCFQEGRIAQQVTSLEDETGYKLRVLAQNYPETPGQCTRHKSFSKYS